jgi:glycosyltransferase involved in cell wall biosynthesis
MGPGKGIEWGLDAMSALGDLAPAPRYVVAGQTHPKVLDRDGEAYRESLKARSKAAGVSGLVEFDPDHRNAEALMAMARQADVVLLPYDSQEQVTSGVLVEAIVARRPVVATRFPHAVELLSGGAGILVPHQDPDAIAAAIRRILTEPGLAAAMSARAADIAPALEWTAVAGRYRQLAGELVRNQTPVAA